MRPAALRPYLAIGLPFSGCRTTWRNYTATSSTCQTLYSPQPGLISKNWSTVCVNPYLVGIAVVRRALKFERGQKGHH